MVRTWVKGMQRPSPEMDLHIFQSVRSFNWRKLPVNWRGCTETSIRPINASAYLLEFTRGKQRPIHSWITKIKLQISLKSRLKKSAGFGTGKTQSLKHRRRSSAHLLLQSARIPVTAASGCWLPPANYSSWLMAGRLLLAAGAVWRQQLRDTFTSSSPKMTPSRPPPFRSHRLIADRAGSGTGGITSPWSVGPSQLLQPHTLHWQGAPGPSWCKKAQGETLWHGERDMSSYSLQIWGIFWRKWSQSCWSQQGTCCLQQFPQEGRRSPAQLPGCTHFPGALATKQ